MYMKPVTFDTRAAPIDEGERHDPSLTFDVIAWLREQSGLPVIVKGVLRGDDARRCLEAGASAVIELARQIPKIAAFSNLKQGITVNPGVISGGTRTNVVAAVMGVIILACALEAQRGGCARRHGRRSW